MHPRFLDRQALVACWREGLLAQAVIGNTSGGYANHPQLTRFRAADEPLATLGAFLAGVVDEADARGYRFARDKILALPVAPPSLPLTQGQLDYEWAHLMAKLAVRSPDRAAACVGVAPAAHPLFSVVPGAVEAWERI